MKIIVLGGGMVGSAIVADLCKDNKVTCADFNKEVLNSISKKLSVKTISCDFSNLSEVKKTIAPFDLVIGAVPGFLGFEVLKAIIESKKNVVDISFFPEDAFLLDDLAKKNNVTAIVDCGVAPGLCNMMAGLHNKQMKLSSYECLVGGLPIVRIKPYEYKAPFSPVDVLEEYTRPARYIENGKLVTKEALSEVEQISFEQCGTLEYFNSDGLRSLITTLPDVPDMKEKTLRYPGHADLMRIYRESGFFEKNKIKIKNTEVAPIDLISKLLFSEWKYKQGEEDFTIMRVTLAGTDAKGAAKIIYTLYDRYNKETETMSMARTTGYTCTAAAHLIMENKFSRKGISPPEFVGEDEPCFNFVLDYLEKRNVRINQSIIRGNKLAFA
jgi:saccharopine dehydrogenase-like NADP-dependent oxidoreductase